MLSSTIVAIWGSSTFSPSSTEKSISLPFIGELITMPLYAFTSWTLFIFWFILSPKAFVFLLISSFIVCISSCFLWIPSVNSVNMSPKFAADKRTKLSPFLIIWFGSTNNSSTVYVTDTLIPFESVTPSGLGAVIEPPQLPFNWPDMLTPCFISPLSTTLVEYLGPVEVWESLGTNCLAVKYPPKNTNPITIAIDTIFLNISTLHYIIRYYLTIHKSYDSWAIFGNFFLMSYLNNSHWFFFI